MATQYTYENAATASHPNKQGCNRITWDDNGSVNQQDWTMLNKEYIADHFPCAENSMFNKILHDYHNRKIDMLKCRSEIKISVLPNFNTLSDFDKKIMVRLFVYPSSLTQADIDALFTSEEQAANWDYVVDNTALSREQRVKYLRKKVSYLMTKIQSRQLANDVRTMMNAYLFESELDLILFFQNTADVSTGIDFTSTGFASKNYYKPQVEQLVIDVLVNGNY